MEFSAGILQNTVTETPFSCQTHIGFKVLLTTKAKVGKTYIRNELANNSFIQIVVTTGDPTQDMVVCLC
jgi:hypothetical protein